MYFVARIIKKMRLPAIKQSVISKKAKVCSGCQVVNSSLGDFSYLGYDSKLLFSNVGKYCSIGDNCIIGGADHPLSYVSTSPHLYIEGGDAAGRLPCWDSYSKRISIGNDVWIGTNVIVKSGVSISDGSVIGMGSVVTKSVGPYEIWAGNPAKLIKKRFSDEVISELLKIKWWDLDKTDLDKLRPYFDSPSQLIEVYFGMKGAK